MTTATNHIPSTQPSTPLQTTLPASGVIVGGGLARVYKPTYAAPSPAYKRLGKPMLRFCPYAWAKLLFMRDRGATEVGAFGLSFDLKDPMLVGDLFFPPQECGPCHTTFTDDGVAKFFDDMIVAKQPAERYANIWVHTHPDISPEPSSKDEETFREKFGLSDWAVMFIIATNGRTYARLRTNIPTPLTVEMDVEIDWNAPFPASSRSKWAAEYEANVNNPKNKEILAPVRSAEDVYDGSFAEELRQSYEDPLYGLPAELSTAIRAARFWMKKNPTWVLPERLADLLPAEGEEHPIDQQVWAINHEGNQANNWIDVWDEEPRLWSMDHLDYLTDEAYTAYYLRAESKQADKSDAEVAAVVASTPALQLEASEILVDPPEASPPAGMPPVPLLQQVPASEPGTSVPFNSAAAVRERYAAHITAGGSDRLSEFIDGCYDDVDLSIPGELYP